MTFIENNQVMNTNKKKSIKVIYIIQKGRYRFIFYANVCVFGASNKPRERLFRKQKKIEWEISQNSEQANFYLLSNSRLK